MAFTAYVFQNVRPGTKLWVYLHGFSRDSAVSYSVRPIREFGFGSPVGAQLTVGAVIPHVDGTLARIAYVEGIWHDHIGDPPYSSIALDVIEEAV